MNSIRWTVANRPIAAIAKVLLLLIFDAGENPVEAGLPANQERKNGCKFRTHTRVLMPSL